MFAYPRNTSHHLQGRNSIDITTAPPQFLVLPGSVTR